jgi:hypothetical protein
MVNWESNYLLLTKDSQKKIVQINAMATQVKDFL